MPFFKSIIAYRIGPDWVPPAPDALEAELQRLAFRPCEPTQELSTGWLPPRGEENGAMAEHIAGHLVLKFGLERRAVPASVVRAEVEARCKAIEAERGRKPGRKEKLDIKQEVVLTMLPRAFSKRAAHVIWIDLAQRFLVVGAGSHKAADSVVSSLVDLMADLRHVLPLALLSTQMAPGTAMAEWLRADEAPGEFGFGQDLVLKNAEKGSIRYARHPLDAEEIVQHLDEGMVVTEMALSWDGKLGFVLNDGLALRKLDFMDVKTDLGEKEKGFDADVAIATGELSRLLPALLEALGGEMMPGAAPAAVAPAQAAQSGDAEAPPWDEPVAAQA
ncbi:MULTISPECIES: recombination-associated protein RdgC [Ramlibacter]|uniref:Recombination-associated protein RdgC n=1 Tax=Ramlibacter aquaticus TaxID=2780094 RepID=A0ABR9SHK2_9BURK|nr:MULTISPECIES: recombination-associated protein RdgC [Ramlibacter]MBE7941765.1 recombination-associated protein RdgC [Ramlibacter aquaticus]